MKFAFVVYSGMTCLDFIGAFDPLTRLKTMNFMPEVEWDVCGLTETVVTGAGLCMDVSVIGKPLVGYDLLIVPGGFICRELMKDNEFIDWLKTAKNCKMKTSVCTGSLLLGAAGFLYGKKATTHPSAYDILAPFCDKVVTDRVVDENNIITARGVSSSIDLGLHICSRLAGVEVAGIIARQMDYPYYRYDPVL